MMACKKKKKKKKKKKTVTFDIVQSSNLVKAWCKDERQENQFHYDDSLFNLCLPK